MITIFVLLLGLIFGSFIAAYSYRYPRGIKISKGYSFCDSCKRKINWYENIPLVSFVFLQGKCKTCKKKISPRYPIIESATGLAFLLLFKYNGGQFDFNLLLLFTFHFLLSLIFIIDLEYQIIPDDFVFGGIIITFIYMFFFKDAPILPSILSGLIGSTFLLLVYIVTKGRGMGLGDVKFALFGGMLVGLANLFTWMLLGFLTGAITGIILILLGSAKLKDKIAFGPFLVIAIPLTFIFGQRLSEIIGIPLH